MQRVIVTGGAGFIGSHLVDKLIEQKIEVIVFDDLSTGKIENVNPKAKLIDQVTTYNQATFNKSDFEGVDTIFHLAASTSVQESIEQPLWYNQNNVNGLLNILTAAATIDTIKRVVFSSSSSVYGDAKSPTSENHSLNPISPYALSKLIGEVDENNND